MHPGWRTSEMHQKSLPETQGNFNCSFWFTMLFWHQMSFIFSKFESKCRMNLESHRSGPLLDRRRQCKTCRSCMTLSSCTLGNSLRFLWSAIWGWEWFHNDPRMIWLGLIWTSSFQFGGARRGIRLGVAHHEESDEGLWSGYPGSTRFLYVSIGRTKKKRRNSSYLKILHWDGSDYKQSFLSPPTEVTWWRSMWVFFCFVVVMGCGCFAVPSDWLSISKLDRLAITQYNPICFYKKR